MPTKKSSSSKKKASRKGVRKSTKRIPKGAMRDMRSPLKYAKWIPESGPERKRVTGFDVGITVPVGAVFSPFTAINPTTEGVAASQRIGRVINVKSVELRWTFYPGDVVAANPPHTQCRIVLVYDKNNQGAQTPNGTVFLGGATPKFNSLFQPLEFPNRFMLLADVISDISQEVDGADAMGPVTGVIRIPCDLQGVFSGPTANITDMSSGSISIAVAGNSESVGALAGQFIFTGSVEYTDV